jgi:hypothetical protein
MFLARKRGVLAKCAPETAPARAAVAAPAAA